MRRTHHTGHRGLVAALEAEQVAEAAAAPIGDNAESLETDLINVAELGAEGDDNDADTQEACEVAEALESIAEALGISAQNGGMDKHSAHAVGVAVDHLYKRIGLKRIAMPAMESFGGTSSRVGATHIAMEDIKEQAKKIWDAIVAAIQKAIEWCIAYYNSVFDAATKLQARAKALAGKAEMTSGKAKAANFESEKLIKALHTGSSVAVGSASIKNINDLAKSIFDDTHFYTEALGEGVLADLANADIGKTFVEKFALPAFSGVNGMKEITNPEAVGMAAAAEGLAVFRGIELPGGMALVMRAPKAELKGAAAIAAVPGIMTTIAPFDGKASAPTGNTVSVLSTDEAAAIAKGVEELAGHLLGYKTQQAKLTELKKKIAAAAIALGKKVTDDETETAGIKAVQRVAGTIPKWIDSPAKDFARYSVNTGKALLDLIEESLKQYDTKASAEPAAIPA